MIKISLLTALLFVASSSMLASASPERHLKSHLRSLQDCCDPATEPGQNGNPICSDGYICCPDDEWSCGIGDGTYRCNEGPISAEDANPCFEFTDPQDPPPFPIDMEDPPAPPTDCCDPDGEPGPSVCLEGATCCPDGTWGCSIGAQGQFACGDEVLFEPDGVFCDICTLPSVVGDCDAAIPRFYFNKKSLTCELFTYGGCGGNSNNFETQADCEANCQGFTPPPPPPVRGCCDPLREPGTNGNPTCFEGHACCPEGVWSCSIGDGITFPCDDGDLIENPEGEICATTQEEEEEEEEEQSCCDPNVKLACLIGTPACCAGGRWACPDGETGIYPCLYTAFPQGPICGEEGGLEGLPTGGGNFGNEDDCDPSLKPDGSDGGPICTDGVTCCPNGDWTCGIGNGANPCNDGTRRLAECDPESEPGQNGNPFCTDGYECCEDGNWSCGIGDGTSPCTGDVTQGDGPELTVELACCDPDDVQGCVEGRACCPDGTWGCSIGDNSNYACGDEVLTNPTGPICETTGGCCDPDLMPLCFIGNAACCPQGTWACPNGLTNLYPCGPSANPDGFECDGDDFKEEEAVDITQGGTICFPGEATVEVKTKGLVSMENLNLGDHVLTESGFSKVYSFGHYQPNVNAVYLQLSTKETTLKISKDHMVFVNSKTSVAAGSLKVGDKMLLASGSAATIIKISQTRASGAFAPFTETGLIVVDGVVASNYIAMDTQDKIPFSQQWLAHTFQAPHRLYCRLFGCIDESYTANGVSIWVAMPHRAFKSILQQHSFLQALVWIVMLPLLAAGSALEAPFLTLCIAAGMWYLIKSKKQV